MSYGFMCGVKEKGYLREEKYRQTTPKEHGSVSISARIFGIRFENYMYKPYEEGSNFSCVLIHVLCVLH